MDPFLAQIVMFGGNFAPRGWALCDGQLLPISQYSALFSILGTTFGGDGRTTFALPGLRGRVPIHAGNGPGLSNRHLGSKGGLEDVTLNNTQIPSHYHFLSNVSFTGNATLPVSGSVEVGISDDAANNNKADGNILAKKTTDTSGDTINIYASGAPSGKKLGGVTHNLNATGALSGTINNGNTGNTGGNLSHHNMQPWLALNYIIALQGVFPSRS